MFWDHRSNKWYADAQCTPASSQPRCVHTNAPCCAILQVRLNHLSNLSKLEHLSIELPHPPAAVANAHNLTVHNYAELRRAIPELTALTALHLGGRAAGDQTLEQVWRLTGLQELVLTKVSTPLTSAAAFGVLPDSLTRLHVEGAGDTPIWEGPAGPGPDIVFR